MSFKLDLHIHTEAHGSTVLPHDKLRHSIKQNGIDGVAVTNFSDISNAVWLKKKLSDCIIIVGQEVWTQDGHIIGLGLKERIDDWQSASDTVGLIHDQGGIAVAPHPYLNLGIGGKIRNLAIDAVEAYSAIIGTTLIFNYLAKRVARQCELPQIASSDTMDAKLVGRSYTNVLTTECGEILNTIKEGGITVKKRPIAPPVIFILKNILNFSNFEPCPIHAIPCYICKKSIAVRLLKRECLCLNCGDKVMSRILCCNGHFLCRKCLLKRGIHNKSQK